MELFLEWFKKSLKTFSSHIGLFPIRTFYQSLFLYHCPFIIFSPAVSIYKSLHRNKRYVRIPTSWLLKCVSEQNCSKWSQLKYGFSSSGQWNRGILYFLLRIVVVIRGSFGNSHQTCCRNFETVQYLDLGITSGYNRKCSDTPKANDPLRILKILQ